MNVPDFQVCETFYCFMSWAVNFVPLLTETYNLVLYSAIFMCISSVSFLILFTSPALGTNTGAALVNIDTGMTSWICRCKSDVFSVQLDQSVITNMCSYSSCPLWPF